MLRATRSGKFFAQWSGPSVSTTNPDFDFKAALKRAIDNECDDDDYEAIFSLSPLSSPVPSRPSSPGPCNYTAINTILPDSGTGVESTLKSSTIHAGLQRDRASCTFEEAAEEIPSGTAQAQPQRRRKKKPQVEGNVIKTVKPKLDGEETEAQARRKRKKKDQGHRNASAKRAALNQQSFSPYVCRPAVFKKYVLPSNPIRVEVEASKANVASTGYVGLDDKHRGKEIYSLDQLVGEDSEFKFTLIPWDGIEVMPIVTQDGHLGGVLAGNPDPAKWPRLQRQAAEMLANAQAHCKFPQGAEQHRRGNFNAVRCGVSHGGGQHRPSGHYNSKMNAGILEDLNAQEPFQRLSGFATSVMATWAPDLHAYYDEKLAALHQRYPHLKRLFPTSVFAASTHNLGPQTVCYKHLDFANLPFGMCAITAFGSYDHEKGGHLVLWDYHLVIQFPPGATILIPSAIVAHSNVPIAANETRFSFTQYTAGGIFRWVENGFRRLQDFKATLSVAQKKELQEKNKARWAFGLSLIPYKELVATCMECPTL